MPIIQLPYHSNSTRIFNAIRDLPYPCWLDSGKPKSHSGRYDIMAAAPSKRWVSQAGITKIMGYQYSMEGEIHREYTLSTTQEPPLSLLKSASQALIEEQHSNSLNLPFIGGIISYFSYNLGHELLSIERHSTHECNIPNMAAGLYKWAIVQDHHQQQCWMVAFSSCSESLLKHIQARIRSASTDTPNTFSLGTLHSHLSEQAYYQKIAAIHEYIRAGDCYQVNFAQRFSASYEGDPYEAYLQLREAMASPFSAYMGLDNHQHILSLSPERFLKINHREVLTQPIKGTAARSQDHNIDQRNAQELQDSSKNRAENVMIVDLLRNDLGKNCQPGSIKVPRLFALESFPNVHHLVSNVTGTLAAEKSPLDVFEGCFPGGSITGAPKKRAMEIIESLESCQRSIYCGSIAYINADGHIDSNIAIRTIACDGDTLHCWGGGGIVADSEATEEYKESLTKINTILETLKTFTSKE